MSVPVTPTSARRRPVSQGIGADGNENSGTGSWLGAFGEMMGELLQSWGILGALKRRGWGTAGARSTPNTPPPFSRSSSPTHEQIELSHLNIQCRQNVEGGCRVERVGSSDIDVRRRVRGCRGRPNPSRHSFHEGASPDSYLLTALLIHSLKHGSGMTCSEAHCHLCMGRQYAGPRSSVPFPPDTKECKKPLLELQLPSVVGGPLEESSNPAIEDASPDLADPLSLPSDAAHLPSSDTFLSTCESDFGAFSEQTSSCKESDASLSFRTDAATLTDLLADSRPYCTSSFFGDISCDSATLTGHNFELPKDSIFEERSSAALDCDLSSSVCSLPCRLWPRKGDALERPVFASGSLVLVPRRPSLSSSNTGPSSHFRWEENPCYLRIEGARPGRGHNFRATTLERPAWCDACAHLVFYHATTCANCSLTCHEQCQNVVSLDCKIASSDEESLLENDFPLDPPSEEIGTFDQARQPPHVDLADEKAEESLEKEENQESETEKNEPESEENAKESDEEEKVVAEKEETPEKNEDVLDAQDYSTLKKSEEASTLRRTVYRIQSQAVDSAKIEEWVRKCPLTNVGLQIAKELDGGYRGCLRIHLNLCRPINIVAGTRPPSIYDILQEDRTMEKTLTSFYMPRDAVKAIHITSKTTTREVIVALLRKFKVVDNPHKFALYERTYDAGQSMRAKLRRLSDSECPLVLAIAWNAQGITNKRLVLQENDTADIQWEAFSLPELANFLRILDREEGEYKNQIKDKYSLLRQRIQSQLARIAPVNT